MQPVQRVHTMRNAEETETLHVLGSHGAGGGYDRHRQ